MMTKQRIWELVFAGLAVAIGISLLLTPFSSPLPDGLEALAQKLSFQDRARSFWPAPMARVCLSGERGGMGERLAGGVFGHGLDVRLGLPRPVDTPSSKTRP